MPIEQTKKTIIQESITGTLDRNEITEILINYFKQQNIYLEPQHFSFNIWQDIEGTDSTFDSISINKEIELTTS
ncbi:hypothetical protein [Caulobacter phage Cr30]|uniref:hypothetical protein n=1 Tax=Caulobacter phage Cr30 TaxID=1357714 RepID=UPI0004A9BA14|nr:hypothetical protein OZ74_gp182 [Caulobacter phage Cr30]AGS81161.1 hypothetical protein [Caulobacter phage Cr30]